MVIGLYKRV